MDIRAGKGVRSIVVLKQGESGDVTRTTVYRKKKKKKKKGTLGVREMEKAVRTLGRAQQVFTDTLLKRHRKSNRKSKDGWLTEMAPNVLKAGQKSWREVSKRVGI